MNPADPTRCLQVSMGHAVSKLNGETLWLPEEKL